ncbi:unnamed protein product, partial [Oppiella nova]
MVGLCAFRKTLYHNVYEYDSPLFHSSLCKFEFISYDDCELENPWKESFKQLYRGVHVRPGYQEQFEANPERYKGRNITYFDRIEQAFTYSEELENS